MEYFKCFVIKNSFVFNVLLTGFKLTVKEVLFICVRLEAMVARLRDV